MYRSLCLTLNCFDCFDFDKDTGNVKIKAFDFEPESEECKRVLALLTTYVDSADWHTFEEEVGLLVTMQRDLAITTILIIKS